MIVSIILACNQRNSYLRRANCNDSLQLIHPRFDSIAVCMLIHDQHIIHRFVQLNRTSRRNSKWYYPYSPSFLWPIVGLGLMFDHHFGLVGAAGGKVAERLGEAGIEPGAFH